MQSTSPISGMPNTRSGVVRGTGGFSIILLPFALIIGAIGAVAVGAALYFSGKLVYLIFISALFAALLAGAVAIITIQVGKVRNNLLAFLLGAIIGITAYSAYRVIEYLDFVREQGNSYREEIRNALTSNGQSASDTDVEELLNEFLKSETGETGFMGLMKSIDLGLQEEVQDTGFIGFTKYLAQEGFTISDVGRTPSSSDMPIKDGLAWGYWGIELLMFIFGGGLMATSKSKLPYCTEEGRWLKYRPQAEVSAANADAFMMAFRNNDLRSASQYLQPLNNKTPLPKLYLELGRCNDQVPDGIVKITAMRPAVKKNSNNNQVLFDGEVSNVNLLFNR